MPIPGARRITHLEENLAAVNIGLSDDQLMALDNCAPIGAAVGTRYPEAMMGSLNG